MHGQIQDENTAAATASWGREARPATRDARSSLLQLPAADSAQQQPALAAQAATVAAARFRWETAIALTMALSYAFTVGLSRNSLYTAKAAINREVHGAYDVTNAVGYATCVSFLSFDKV